MQVRLIRESVLQYVQVVCLQIHCMLGYAPPFDTSQVVSAPWTDSTTFREKNWRRNFSYVQNVPSALILPVWGTFELHDEALWSVLVFSIWIRLQMFIGLASAITPPMLKPID